MLATTVTVAGGLACLSCLTFESGQAVLECVVHIHRNEF
jgi:hypothetical protein